MGCTLDAQLPRDLRRYGIPIGGFANVKDPVAAEGRRQGDGAAELHHKGSTVLAGDRIEPFGRQAAKVPRKVEGHRSACAVIGEIVPAGDGHQIAGADELVMRIHLRPGDLTHEGIAVLGPLLLLGQGIGIIAALVRGIGGEKSGGVIPAVGDNFPDGDPAGSVGSLILLFGIKITRFTVDDRLVVNAVTAEVADVVGGLLHHRTVPGQGRKGSTAAAARGVEGDDVVIGIELIDQLSPVLVFRNRTAIVGNDLFVLAGDHPDHILGGISRDQITDEFVELGLTELDILLGPGEKHHRHDTLAVGIIDALVDPLKIAGVEAVVVFGFNSLLEAGAALIFPEAEAVDVAHHDGVHGGVALLCTQVDILLPAPLIRK
ncbi:MAG: hypothetical protein BWY77_01262 [bacterium ADurb.Bin431]|nr:MAG: hypothetical protein BWY77_01262 [bacterium ADurb.Bin431]